MESTSRGISAVVKSLLQRPHSFFFLDNCHTGEWVGWVFSWFSCVFYIIHFYLSAAPVIVHSFYFILNGSAIRAVDGCVFSCRGFLVLFMSYIFIYPQCP